VIEDYLRYHAGINDSILAMIDHIPDDQLDFASRPDSWTIKQILVHIARARHYWLDSEGEPGQMSPLTSGVSRQTIKDLIAESWERFERYARKPDANLIIVFSRLTHDVHHRSEVLSALATLGVPANVIDGFEHYGPQPDPLI
jgi:uncharacterized damage-inducible protein DinB